MESSILKIWSVIIIKKQKNITDLILTDEFVPSEASVALFLAHPVPCPLHSDHLRVVISDTCSFLKNSVAGRVDGIRIFGCLIRISQDVTVSAWR